MFIFELIKSIVLGIVEGITEWLPVSSTGHLILVEEFLNLNVSEEFKEMFNVVIQLGAILAVIILFWKKIWPFQTKTNGSTIKKDSIMLWLKIIVACVPAVILVLLGLDEKCEQLFYKPIPIALALIIVGIVFIIVEYLRKGKADKSDSLNDITFLQAALIGIFQLVAAVFPGTSRSGATIIGGLSLGVSRVTAAEFTFVLSIPVMAGASLLKLLDFGFDFTAPELVILLAGFLTAFIISLIAIKFLMNFVKRHDFKIFAYYRIALGIAVLLYFYIIK
ncbi:MAG: undecaprenyl-diphosphate phosphatase [Oscillospiraceae bacterium]|nr:undecaprenyl-diphosphate phosphatase [Oscillospiraceae bacterium]